MNRIVSRAISPALPLILFTLLPGVSHAAPGPDFGDAPAPYPTLLQDNGASHPVDPAIFLGGSSDPELDGIPSDGADGDDLSGVDDEDGVLLPTFVVRGEVFPMDVTANAVGILNAWIDFGVDGSWNEPGDQIFIDRIYPVGSTETISVPVPVDAVADTRGTYARFRFDDTGTVGPDGVGGFGEVEDYKIIVIAGTDFGDAPAVYGTLLADDGARHYADDVLYLGSGVDTEANGHPGATSNGDDNNNLDDENGVQISGPLVRGNNASVQVLASDTGMLNAWIDFNADGDWGDPGEQVFTDVALASGVNSLVIAVPATAAASQATYARFRLDRLGGLTPLGLATSGEVEDYRVLLDGIDYGDAPDPAYPTLAANNGARHLLSGGHFLGGGIDEELDGQPNADATGDTDDGVVFQGEIVSGQTGVVDVEASETSRLDAWIDFNADGDWDDPGEQIFASAVLNAGANPGLSYTVPDTITAPTVTFARFRSSANGGLASTGAASSGEVEDYQVLLQPFADFGDAPDPTYPTLAVNDGPYHLLGSGIYLGEEVSAELDGQPTADADGDSDDGFALQSPLTTEGYVPVRVTVSQDLSFVSIWIDFNGDGDWDDTGEDLFVGMTADAGVNIWGKPVLPGTELLATPKTFARVRVASVPVLSPTGFAPDGEVEDHAIAILPLDYGDAPDPSYPTLRASDGARHVVDGLTFLGVGVDGEPDALASAGADGDDTDAVDDENGVLFTSELITGGTASIEVTTSVSGYLSAWIDFDGDGAWATARDEVFLDTPLAPGANPLNFPVPVGISSDVDTFARFRFSSTEGLLLPTGFASDGEVEDYAVTIEGIPPIDCTGADVRDLLGPESGTDISIAYLDPLAGGSGGKLRFGFVYPEEVDLVTVESEQSGFTRTIAANGTSSSMNIDTVTNGSPDDQLSAQSYSVYYEREVVPGSGVYVRGAPCVLNVTWTAPTCTIVFDPEFPAIGAPATAQIQLTNAKYGSAFPGAYGGWRKDGAGDFNLLTGFDSVAGRTLILNNAIAIPSWSADDAGLYSVELANPDSTGTCSVEVGGQSMPIDCTGAKVADGSLGEIGTNIAIKYRDPLAGGIGGMVAFTFDHPAEVTTILVEGDDGFFVTFGATGTQSTLNISTLGNSSPSPDIDTTTYTVSYGRPESVSSGNLVFGATCAIKVSWAEPLCTLTLNPFAPVIGQSEVMNVNLLNARYDAVNNRFGVFTSDASAGPASVILDEPDFSGPNGLTYNALLDTSSWSEANYGTYTVSLNGAGASFPSNVCVRVLDGTEGDPFHSADTDTDGVFSFSEVLRVIQLYNTGVFGCADPPSSTDDGFLPGSVDVLCNGHDGDYDPQNWRIDLSELLRLIQFYTLGGYSACPEVGEDEFCPPS